MWEITPNAEIRLVPAANSASKKTNHELAVRQPKKQRPRKPIAMLGAGNPKAARCVSVMGGLFYCPF